MKAISEFVMTRLWGCQRVGQQRRPRSRNKGLLFQQVEPRLLLASLLTETDFSYLGSFRVPQQTSQDSRFGYGGTAPAFNPENNSLFVVGHDHHQAIAEITIPDLVNSNNVQDLNTASFLQPFTEIESKLSNFTLNSRSKIGGLEVIRGQLTGTFYEYYDGDYSARESHFQLSSTDLSDLNITGLHQVGSDGGGFVGGYMTKIPLEWQDELGAPYLTGQAALAIIGRTSSGPAAYGFDPANLGDSATAAIPYVNYPSTNQLRPNTSTNPVFNLTTGITGVVFPQGSSSIVFFGRHGTGQYCYGTGQECNDPTDNSKGTHSFGGEYEYQAWAYDVKDFIAAKNGDLQPWELEPYDIWNFDLPIADAARNLGGVTYDAATGRMFIVQQGADFDGEPYPLISVFQLPTESSGSTDPVQQDPVISQVTVGAVTSQTANLSWTTDVPASSQVEFGTTVDLGQSLPMNADWVTSHTAPLAGLEPDTTYYFRVVSQDAAGRTSVSAVESFSTDVAVVEPDIGYSWANPQPLPAPDPATTVRVDSVSRLVNAVSNLASGQTIEIAAGTYNLAGSVTALYIPQGISDWAIRGETGRSADVIIQGAGMDGAVQFGFWIGNSTGGTIADLTLDGFREHGIIANPGAHDMLYHGLRIVDIGDQFIKSNPVASGDGNDRGIVQYSVFEYRTAAPDSYTNAIDVHGGDGWLIQQNLFRNFIAPAGEGLAGPAVLIWNGSRNTTVDGNVFIDSARGVSLGLIERDRVNDHHGGVVKNNFFYRQAGLDGATDVPIHVADSPGTRIHHNTVFDQRGYPNAIEYRFGATVDVDIRNNLTNTAITARDGAAATVGNNLTNATSEMFVDASTGNLHLRSTASSAIDQGVAIVGVGLDIDGQIRDSQPDLGAHEFGSPTASREYAFDYDGGTLRISGDHRDNIFTWAAATPLTINIDGQDFSLRSGLTRIEIDGADGSDRVVVTGSTGDDVLVATPTGSSFLMDALVVAMLQTEEHLFDGLGGMDQLHLQDTSGDDVAVIRDDYSRLAATDWLFESVNFDRQTFRAIHGGVDSVSLSTSGDAARLVGGSNLQRLNSGERQLMAVGFENATVDASGNDNRLYLRDSAGDDLVTLGEMTLDYVNAEFTLNATGFATQVITSRNGGIDTATFQETSFDDGVYSYENFTVQRGGGLYMRANDFSVTHASTQSSTDLLVILGTAQDDHYSASPTGIHVTNSDTERHFYNFADARGLLGRGSDRVTFYGSAGDDVLNGHATALRLKGAGFNFYVRDFNLATVDGGGGSDSAYLKGTNNLDDTLTLGSGSLQLSNSISAITLSGFTTQSVNGRQGGIDRVVFIDSEQQDRFYSNSSFTRMRSAAGTFSRASGFESVDLVAKSGDDVLKLFGSDNADQFMFDGDVASVTDGNGRRQFTGLKTVTATWDALADTITENPTQYKLVLRQV